MRLEISAVFFAAFASLAPSLHAQTSAAPEIAPADAKDYCDYLKDVEAKTDTDCAPDKLAALKLQDEAGFTDKLAAARKRRSEVEAAYEFLKTLPPANDAWAGRKTPPAGPNPMDVTPPINDRTFPAWIGANARDSRAVYAKWLQAQSANLEQERQAAVSDGRRAQIASQLARNRERISSLEKIKDPAQLNCYLGDTCGARGDLHGLGVAATGSGRTWTAADYARANAQTRVGNSIPGGRLDRGVPSIGGIASEVVDNAPFGPLEQGPNSSRSPMRTASELALATTGALMLFGGLGSKRLEEAYPGIRRNMGIAALVGGSLATGALTWRAIVLAAPVLSQPQVQEREDQLLQEVEPAAERLSQAASDIAPQGSGVAGPAKTPLDFAINKDEARAVVSKLNLPADQAKSALSAVRRATTSSNFRISMDADNVLIRTVRAGRNGYQLMEYRIAPDGTKSVVQTAYDAAGKLVHYDPK